MLGKKNQLLINKGGTIIAGILLLFFITDALNVVLIRLTAGQLGYTSPYTQLSALSKGFIISIYLVYALVYKTSRFIVVFCIISLFLFNASITYYKEGFGFYFTWIIRASKIGLPFILINIIHKLRVNKDRVIIKTYTALVSVQSITVIVACLFNIDLFYTYNHNRFGFIGLLTARNEVTFYYAIAIVFLLKQWEVTNRKLNIFILLLVLIASVLLGAKAVFIIYLSLSVYIILTQRRFNKFSILLLIGGFGIVSLVLLYSIGYFDFYINYWQETNLLTMTTSFRNLLIQERLPVVFANWEWHNYLFGGVNPAISFVEMDIIDMFTYVGIIGSILFYWVLFRTLFRFSKHNYLGWFLVSQYFIIGGLSGHVFASGINSIYLAITCYYLQKYDHDSKDSIYAFGQ